MAIKEGSLVVVIGKIDDRIREVSKKDEEALIVGTLIGYINDKQVQVLLSDGMLVTTNSRDIVPYEEQKESL